MERLAEIMSRWLYQSRKDLKLLWLNHGSFTTDRLSIFIIFIFGILPLTLYFIISSSAYSIVQIIASYIFIILLFSITIVLVITWFKSEQYFKYNVRHHTFLKLNSIEVDAAFFAFEENDVENLIRMVEGLPKTQKIVIRETPKNKQSGSIRFIFTFLELIVKGGILRMDTKSKESLFTLISERFMFQSAEINRGTLPSSYSKWCSATEDGSYDEVRKSISKALGIPQNP